MDNFGVIGSRGAGLGRGSKKGCQAKMSAGLRRERAFYEGQQNNKKVRPGLRVNRNVDKGLNKTDRGKKEGKERRSVEQGAVRGRRWYKGRRQNPANTVNSIEAWWGVGCGEKGLGVGCQKHWQSQEVQPGKDFCSGSGLTARTQKIPWREGERVEEKKRRTCVGQRSDGGH